MSHQFQPIAKIHLGFHAYHAAAHDRSQIVESYHFCSGCGSDDDTVFQCLIYDSPEGNAKLIGIEYLITEKLFNELDAEERKLWHSHKFEVSSGLLTPLQAVDDHSQPGSGGLCVADAKTEEAQMQLIYRTYGKIIHTWHPPSSKLPLGAPTLMMSATDADKGPAADISESGESKGAIRARDERHGVDSVQQRKRRMAYLDLDYKTLEGADAWEHGEGRRFAVEPCSVKLSNEQ